MMLVRWYIRRLDSLINPKCPRPYLYGFGPGTMSPRQAYWTQYRKAALPVSSRKAAFATAREFGPNWRELVRVVRVKETR